MTNVHTEEKCLLHYASIFLGVAAVALVFWFFSKLIATTAVIMAKICFFLFLALFIVFMLIDLLDYYKTKFQHKKQE